MVYLFCYTISSLFVIAFVAIIYLDNNIHIKLICMNKIVQSCVAMNCHLIVFSQRAKLKLRTVFRCLFILPFIPMTLYVSINIYIIYIIIVILWYYCHHHHYSLYDKSLMKFMSNSENIMEWCNNNEKKMAGAPNRRQQTQKQLWALVIFSATRIFFYCCLL